MRIHSIGLLLSSFILMSCDYELWIDVENNSEDTIVVCADHNNYNYFPSNGEVLPYTIRRGDVVVKPHTTSRVWSVATGGEDYDDVFKIASIAIISKDTLDKYGFDDVKANKRTLMVYDIRIEEWEELFGKYIVPYPPQPWMKNIKMYPSYEEYWDNQNNNN